MTVLGTIDRDLLRRLVAEAVKGRWEVGASAVVSACHWAGFPKADRRNVGHALRQLGWKRDGFTGIGYDREPRFTVGGAS